MLHLLFVELADQFTFLNVFRYITFRTGGATMTALLVAFLMGPAFIRWLKKKQKEGQPIREDGPQSHIVAKAGTPTMGGGLILLSIIVATLLWADLTNGYVWVVLGVTAGFGLVGFADDYRKVTRSSHAGVPGRVRLAIEFVIAFIAVWAVMMLSTEELTGNVAVPFFKDVLVQLGFFYIVFGGLVIVGASNAVNLTDGLDGLAIVPVMIAAASFGLIAYLIGNAVFSDYLQIHFVQGTGELAIICGAIIGAGLGFLWFNAPPAAIFMGDTGSLGLGGMLGGLLSQGNARAQVLALTGRLPDEVIACVGGGSNAIGAFHPFVDDEGVRLIGVEAAGHGLDTPAHAASLKGGRPGVLHGNRTYLLQDEDGQIIEGHSISAGLDYPGIGPEHAWLKDTGRVTYLSATDNEALDAFKMCTRLEGIIPALEPSHALAKVKELAPTLPKDHLMVMNLCGRGDKDVFAVAGYLGVEL